MSGHPPAQRIGDSSHVAKLGSADLVELFARYFVIEVDQPVAVPGKDPQNAGLSGASTPRSARPSAI